MYQLQEMDTYTETLTHYYRERGGGVYIPKDIVP